MTTYEIQTKTAIYSNEMLREIIASNAARWAWFKFHARAELARRDLVAGLA
jgi:hypothetical protein